MNKQLGINIVFMIATVAILFIVVVVGLSSSLQSSQQQVSFKSSSVVEMFQGNGTNWIVYGGNIYQSDNATQLLNGALQYFQGTVAP